MRAIPNPLRAVWSYLRGDDLKAADQRAVNAHTARTARRHSQTLGAEAATTELRYLTDKGFVETPPKTISPEIQTWRITAAGRDWLAQHGGAL